MGRTKKKIESVRTVLKSLGQCSFTRNGDPSAIDVKDGKILRIRPLHFDEKYTKRRAPSLENRERGARFLNRS